MSGSCFAFFVLLQFLQLLLHFVQFCENFIALFGILGTLMVACELIDLRGKMRNLHASGKTRVHVDGGGVVQNHLRA